MSEVNKFIQVEDLQPPTKKNYYLFVLDASGSMDGVREVTRTGLNEQLQTIRADAKEFKDQEYYVTLLSFNTKVNPLYVNIKITLDGNDVPDITKEQYDPNGGTALYDAMAYGIRVVKESAEAELKNPLNKVQMVVLTDGEENSSVEYPRYDGGADKIKGMLEALQGTKQWTVAYLGCDHDVLRVASDLGIHGSNVMSYSGGAQKSIGTKSAFDTMKMSSHAYSVCRAKDTLAEVDGAICSTQDLTSGYITGVNPAGEVKDTAVTSTADVVSGNDDTKVPVIPKKKGKKK